MRALMMREDLPPSELRRLARAEGAPRVARRHLAIAGVPEGMSREAAAGIAGLDRQTQRDWVVRTNRGGQAGLSDRRGDGRPCRLTQGRQATLKAARAVSGSRSGSRTKPAQGGRGAWSAAGSSAACGRGWSGTSAADRPLAKLPLAKDVEGFRFAGTRAIVDTCCDPWNGLIAKPGRSRSLAGFEWAKRGMRSCAWHHSGRQTAAAVAPGVRRSATPSNTPSPARRIRFGQA
jgi:hypothetical protein